MELLKLFNESLHSDNTVLSEQVHLLCTLINDIEKAINTSNLSDSIISGVKVRLASVELGACRLLNVDIDIFQSYIIESKANLELILD